jgi:hypothetical protein
MFKKSERFIDAIKNFIKSDSYSIKYEPDEVELDKLLKEYKKNRLKDRFSK